MQWNPALLSEHYTAFQVVLSWGVIFPLVILGFVFFTIMFPGALENAILLAYNKEAHPLVRILQACIICPLLVVLEEMVMFFVFLFMIDTAISLAVASCRRK